jgi:hypothetical protein
MSKKLSFDIKERMVTLAGTCFWFWDSFYSFLDSSGVPKELQRRYPREAFSKYTAMRNILGDLEATGNTAVIEGLVSNFYRLRSPADRDKLDVDRAKGLLAEFRSAVGNDPIERELQNRERKRARAAYEDAVEDRRTQQARLGDLNSRFLSLASTTEVTAQQRGFRLEDLFFDLLQFSEFEYTPPFRTPGNEQVDGHFKYEKFDYLVEAKWEQEVTKQPALSVFDGKIRGKAQSTRGLFLSAAGFDEHGIRKFSGDAPRIVLMTGEDLALVLGGHFSFADAMKAKIDAIVRHGTIHLPLRNS